LEKVNADRDRDRQNSKQQLTEMKQANEAILKAKMDESLKFQSQVAHLTNSMVAQSQATSNPTTMVQQMLNLQSGTCAGPSTPKRRAITQTADPTEQQEAGQKAYNVGNDLLDEK
jgi:hypothetical protein